MLGPVPIAIIGNWVSLGLEPNLIEGKLGGSELDTSAPIPNNAMTTSEKITKLQERPCVVYLIPSTAVLTLYYRPTNSKGS